MTTDAFGRTIQLFLVDGTPSGLMVASIHGWTGSVLVATQTTFATLVARPEADRTGIYILYGPDPDDSLVGRAYFGEADSVRDRIRQSAESKGFWETAVVVTTSDEALTKGHVRYLEARLLELARSTGRATLDNSQMPEADRRRLPEADRANMEAFLANLQVILPVIGLDLLKPRPRLVRGVGPESDDSSETEQVRFEVRHRSGIKALAIEGEGEFVVLSGSQAIRDSGNQNPNYATLKRDMVEQGVLVQTSDDRYQFSRDYGFRSPSAAAAIVLDRNANGRREWRVVGSDLDYHEWQERKAGIGDRVSPEEMPAQ
jgi:hypothetical protein